MQKRHRSVAFPVGERNVLMGEASFEACSQSECLTERGKPVARRQRRTARPPGTASASPTAGAVSSAKTRERTATNEAGKGGTCGPRFHNFSRNGAMLRHFFDGLHAPVPRDGIRADAIVYWSSIDSNNDRAINGNPLYFQGFYLTQWCLDLVVLLFHLINLAVSSSSASGEFLR